MTGSSGAELSIPRSFCGALYPWPLIAELSDGLEVRACYFLRDKRRLETRQNKPYLRLTLGDRTGELVGHVWEDADRWEPLCPAEGVVGIRGRVAVYQNQMQIKVEAIQPLRAEPGDLERLLPTSPRDRAQMERELDGLISSIEDAPLRSLLKRCLGKGAALGREYRAHPAAMRNHHAYLGGLLEHSLSVALVCDRLAAHYVAQGIAVDRDLLLSGALLHDIGKLRELKPLPSAGYTTEGQLLGHIVLGMQIVAREAETTEGMTDERLLLLQHLIASHQGKPEWDSPRVPQLVEALILHYADDLDAKLNQARALLRAVAPGDWSVYDRSLARSLFRPGPQPGADDRYPAPLDEAVDYTFDLFRG
jgi:3'-5' exoribonuclease